MKLPLDHPEESDHIRTLEHQTWCCGGAALAVLFIAPIAFVGGMGG
jgi:hypothetical protein